MRSTIVRATTSLAGRRHLGDRDCALTDGHNFVENFRSFEPRVLHGDRDGDVHLARQRSRHGTEEVARVLGPVALGPCVGVLDTHDELEAAGAADVAQRAQAPAAVERGATNDADDVTAELRPGADVDEPEERERRAGVELGTAVLPGHLACQRSGEALALIGRQAGRDRREDLAYGGLTECLEVAGRLDAAGDRHEHRQVATRVAGWRGFSREIRGDAPASCSFRSLRRPAR
jgi:hypothetical protein